jgi:hypothetical protein
MFGIARSASLIGCLLVVPLSLAAQDKGSVTRNEYQVYNAVLGLMQFPKSDPRIIIVNKTLNTRCGGQSGNPVLINGCGIWGPPISTAEETNQQLRHEWPQMAQSTWESFTTSNSSSGVLQDELTSSLPHRLVDMSSQSAPDWKNPDGAIFLSRVGFNSEQNEALVYVLFFSYVKQIHTSGNFFLFRIKPGKDWESAGRFTYMEFE